MCAKKVVEILVNGGQATAGPPLGPALGPLGLNVLSVVNKINELTDAFVGMKVPIKVEVDVETKEFTVSIGTPTTSALLVKELSIAKGSGTPNTEKVGNLTMDQLIHIAQLKREQLFSKNLKGAVKEILGSCVSVGITVNEKDPKDIQRDIDEGLFDNILRET
jgi:large subunit ribosomal protein L11